MRIRKPNMSGVLAGFTKTIADLKAISENNQKQVDKNFAAIKGYQESISMRHADNVALRGEADVALKIAAQIEELISA